MPDGTQATPAPQGIFGAAQLIVGSRSAPFQGQPWTDHSLIKDGDLDLAVDFQPVFSAQDATRCTQRVFGRLPAGTWIEINSEGLVRIETPQGYRWDFWRRARYESTLNQLPYIDCFATDPTAPLPSTFASATGILPQYDGTNASTFVTASAPTEPATSSSNVNSTQTGTS